MLAEKWAHIFSPYVWVGYLFFKFKFKFKKKKKKKEKKKVSIFKGKNGTFSDQKGK